ncbi:aldehyde dehydrogenase [Pseudonocardia yunnanensis]|uniref:Aldehyde dehydrogenase n=1 Tax=Pseudonocardia yunnanensis TaxID=58107 RepID=A0ABW4FDM1_9PSEU
MAVRSFDKLFVDGQWLDSTGSGRIEVISPHTEQAIASVPDGTAGDMDRAVAAARQAFDQGAWPRLAPEERIATVERFADAFRRRLPEVAEVVSAENGCPITLSTHLQAAGPLAIVESFLTVAKEFPWESQRPGATHASVTVRREPVGVVAAIVPWNVPLILTLSKLVPALLAGCTVVLKPAPETPLDAFVMVEALVEAGLPAGMVNVVPGGREVGEHLVRHRDVDKVAFTGSTAAGRIIAGICGEQLKRCSLELGGKSAAIVLDDADLAVVAEGLKATSLLNSGQGCVNQSRVLASRANYDNVVEAVVGTMRSMPVGDPADPATEIGPMTTRRQQERVEGYIALGEKEGAELVLGGTGRPDGLNRGWYVRPTVFRNADNNMRISREEIFGPVITVIPFDDVDDAVRIANDSEYGLAGSVWTSDSDAGNAVARRVRTGMVGINGFMPDYAAPFGGYKASGIGREFGPEGLSAYTEIKAIYPPPTA